MAYNKTDAARELGISKGELEKRAKAAGFDNTEQYYWSQGKSKAGKSGEYGNLGQLASQGMFEKQKGEEQDFLGRLRGAISKLPTPGDIYGRLSQEAGLPGLAGLRRGLEQATYDIPETVRTIASQVGISAPRIKRRITGQLARIAPSYQRAVGQEQAARQDVGSRLGYEMAGQQRILQPFTVEASMMSDRMGREFSGYTQQVQQQHQLLLNKIQNEQAMSMAEWQQAAQFSLMEQEKTDFQDNYLFQQQNKRYAPTGGVGDGDFTAGLTDLWEQVMGN